MKIGIAGLGLIGGSLAKAFSALEDVEVLGYDINRSVTLSAKLEGAIKDELTEQNIGECNYIIIALYPQSTIDFIKTHADRISKKAIVVDCGGVKKTVCDECFAIAQKRGFCFVGGHPMAGTHFSGFSYSRASLFSSAYMILVPHRMEKIEILAELKALFVRIGFKGVTVTTPEEHDRIIAYTSQLAHVVSSAYIKSPNAKVHKGFSAGSYRDMTRVAKLNPDMWAELFLSNRENLINEIDHLVDELVKYKNSIEHNDFEELRDLLSEGTKIKESID